MSEAMRTWPEEKTGPEETGPEETGPEETGPEGSGAGQPSAGKLEGVPTDERGLPTEGAIRTALKAVLDPEIGINIVDLGLIYGVDVYDSTARVSMTLTSMGCPLTELLHQQVTLVLTRLPGIDNVEVDFTFTPPWSTDMIADDAREELRAMGFNV